MLRMWRGPQTGHERNLTLTTQAPEALQGNATGAKSEDPEPFRVALSNRAAPDILYAVWQSEQILVGGLCRLSVDLDQGCEGWQKDELIR